MPQDLDQRSKTEEVQWCQRCRAADAPMWDNPEGDELDPAEDIRRLCKNSPSVLSCIGKNIREGYDRGSEVRTVYSGRDGKG